MRNIQDRIAQLLDDWEIYQHWEFTPDAGREVASCLRLAADRIKALESALQYAGKRTGTLQAIDEGIEESTEALNERK